MEYYENNIKLYSISAAAKELSIRKETLSNMISEGKIGIVKIGKRNKIPHLELVQFIKNSTIKIRRENNPETKNIDSIIKKHKYTHEKTASEKIDIIFNNLKRK